jgi:cell wall-associated NlpC family hydrolase
VLALVVTIVALAVAVPAGVLVTGGSEVAVAAMVKKRTQPKRPEKKRAKTTPKSKSITTLGERAAKYALDAVGVPYRWGGTSMSGFDCSGLVYWAYRRLGVSVPHNSYALWSNGRRVPRSRLKPGDVLVFSGLGHVGMYIGRGKMVHAPHSGVDVQVVSLARSQYGRRLVGARRFAAGSRLETS